MEDERLVVRDRQELRQIGLRRSHIDVGVAVIPKDPERAIQVEVDRRRLQVLWVVRVDAHVAALERRADVAIRQDAHLATAPFPFSAYRLSTSRLRSSRSSKLW